MAQLNLLSLAIALCTTAVVSGDTVTLAPAVPGASPYSAEGEILDFTGEKLILQGAAGGPRTYAADRVLHVETKWNDKHRNARAAMDKHDHQSAIGLLTAAEREEQRVWVRRMIVAELVQSYAALGQWERAGDLFIALAQSDAATPAYRYAPLSWHATTAVRPEKARTWMARRDVPASVLLGASYLLTTTGDSQAAAQALRGLASQSDGQISALAEAQLWRLDLHRVTAQDVERWEQRAGQFPETLRAGSDFILGEALARIGEHDRAALAYLRVPVLHAENRHLAARALVSAARAINMGGHSDEAQRLLTEVSTDFSDTPQRAEAQALLRNDEFPNDE
ncbi:MAG: hypothetical protein WD851_06510 [Pirellulales bacterium]